MRWGLATGILGLALLLAAALLGSVALFAFALGLQALTWLCLAATWLGARRLVVERTVDQVEVLEGRPIALRFTVRGPGGAAGARRDPGRGRGLAAARARGDPAGDDRAPRRPPGRLPPPCGCATTSACSPRGAGRPATRRSCSCCRRRRAPACRRAPLGGDPGGDPEPDGLQPYLRGTPAGRIHWPSVARAGEWQERRVIAAPRGMPLVVVDLVRRARRGGDRLDAPRRGRPDPRPGARRRMPRPPARASGIRSRWRTWPTGGPRCTVGWRACAAPGAAARPLPGPARSTSARPRPRRSPAPGPDGCRAAWCRSRRRASASTDDRRP